MLTPDHPGLNRLPQDLRNPGAALSDRPVERPSTEMPPALRKSG